MQLLSWSLTLKWQDNSCLCLCTQRDLRQWSGPLINHLHAQPNFACWPFSSDLGHEMCQAGQQRPPTITLPLATTHRWWSVNKQWERTQSIWLACRTVRRLTVKCFLLGAVQTGQLSCTSMSVISVSQSVMRVGHSTNFYPHSFLSICVTLMSVTPTTLDSSTM